MSTIPVNVQIPSAPEAPILADFVEHALRVAYIQRNHVTATPAGEWSSPGVYVLLTGDESGRVYVGQATDLRKRLLQHKRTPKLPWVRAVAIKRDTTHGFNSAEIGYLEGRHSAEVDAIPGLSVVKGRTSADTTLPPHRMLSLGALLESMLAAVRLAGIDIAREAAVPEGKPKTGKRKTPTTIQGTVADLLAAGLIRAGEELHLSQGKVTAKGLITANGGIVVDGVAYSSPSLAAATALKLRSSNGWTTWHVGSLEGPTLDFYRQRWANGSSSE